MKIQIHIFFFLAIIPLIVEMLKISNPKYFFELYEKNRVNDKPLSERETAYQAQVFIGFISVLWSFIGLFSGQWLLFIALIVIRFIPKNFAIMVCIDGCLKFLILLFIIINQYHLHIDNWSIVKAYLFS